MNLPFDDNKLSTLMEDQGADVVLATSKENVRYLLGGYQFFFFAHKDAIGVSRYQPIVGLPKGAPDKAFYIGNIMEGWQQEVEPLWVPEKRNNQWHTDQAGKDAADFIRKLGHEKGTVAVEKCFLPADSYEALQEELPDAKFIDAVYLLEELRAVKQPHELTLLKEASETIVECMLDVMKSTPPGTTMYEVADEMKKLETQRGLDFEYCLTCTGPSFNRAPSNATWDEGNILSLDSGGNKQGYLGDLCRMAVMGEPTPLMEDLLGEIQAVQTAARAVVRPGVTGQEIYEAALKEQARCEHDDQMVFLAHGMGIIQHEAPHLTSSGVVPYPATYETRGLEPGMVVSIETDMKNPEVGFVKLEDTVVVTEDGSVGYGDEGRGWNIGGA